MIILYGEQILTNPGGVHEREKMMKEIILGMIFDEREKNQENEKNLFENVFIFASMLPSLTEGCLLPSSSK